MRVHWNAKSLIVFTVLLLMFMGIEFEAAMAQTKMGLGAQQFQSKVKPLHLTVVLERIYLNGEVSEEVVKESIYSMSNFWAKYDDWQLVEMNDFHFVFRKNMNDISPLLKANGFFGITPDGVLSIFNGKPEQSKIIQSFFQIDIKKLESKKQEELLNGIPIKTKAHYVQVLETFKPYLKNGRQGN